MDDNFWAKSVLTGSLLNDDEVSSEAIRRISSLRPKRGIKQNGIRQAMAFCMSRIGEVPPNLLDAWMEKPLHDPLYNSFLLHVVRCPILDIVNTRCRALNLLALDLGRSESNADETTCRILTSTELIAECTLFCREQTREIRLAATEKIVSYRQHPTIGLMIQEIIDKMVAEPMEIDVLNVLANHTSKDALAEHFDALPVNVQEVAVTRLPARALNNVFRHAEAYDDRVLLPALNKAKGILQGARRK